MRARRDCSGSTKISTKPAKMNESARLKVGQCQEPQWTSIRSRTAPNRIRSTMFPTAPPRIAANPTCRSLLAERRIIIARAVEMAAAIATSSKGWVLVARPKATPLLIPAVMVSQGPTLTGPWLPQPSTAARQAKPEVFATLRSLVDASEAGCIPSVLSRHGHRRTRDRRARERDQEYRLRQGGLEPQRSSPSLWRTSLIISPAERVPALALSPWQPQSDTSLESLIKHT